MSEKKFDVLVIGAGVIGAAVAREMTRYQASVAVLERELDVGFGTSSRNTGVIHGGFNYATGSLKAQCCVEGCRSFDRVAWELDVPFRRTGKVLVGFDDSDAGELEKALDLGKANGVRGLELIDGERLRRLAPNVTGTIALWSPMSGIVDPFQYTIALAENARANGARFFFGREVTEATHSGGRWHIQTTDGEFAGTWVINCAGLGAVRVSEMLGIEGYAMGVFKGEYLVLDNRLSPLLAMPVYPVPNPVTGMGIHVTPTIDGNILVGPNSELVGDAGDASCSQSTLDRLFESGRKLFPSMQKEDVIRSFAGSRAKLVHPETGDVLDFVVETPSRAPGVVNMMGIESPGLTASVPLARRAASLIGQAVMLNPRRNFDPMRKAKLRFAAQTPEMKKRLVEENPDYDEIICRCEEVTRAEVLQAIRSIFGTPTLVGVKNRVRTTMGRCQGGYCQMRLAELLEQETGREAVYNRVGTPLFTGKVRE